MQKILFLVLFITILPVYVFAETFDKSKCDFMETDKNVIKKLEVQGIYQNNKTGVVCYSINDIKFFEKDVMFPIKNGKVAGIVKIYFKGSGALVSETPYKNGEKDGIEKVYFTSGALMFEIPYKNGKKDGIGKKYFASGALSVEIPYKNGEKDGIEKGYYESGDLYTEISYKNGIQEGIEKLYYESGALHTEIPFKNDIKEGIGKSYMEDGRLFSTVTYQNDKVISGKCANGRKWTNAEINNFEKGLYVNCGR